MRVLVIEDNSDIATNIGDYLEDRGNVVDFAGDGVTGLHLAVVHDFDVIVLDLTLPGMDGLEVARKLRHEAHKQTPILMLTARDALEQKLTGFESGTAFHRDDRQKTASAFSAGADSVHHPPSAGHDPLVLRPAWPRAGQYARALQRSACEFFSMAGARLGQPPQRRAWCRRLCAQHRDLPRSVRRGAHRDSAAGRVDG